MNFRMNSKRRWRRLPRGEEKAAVSLLYGAAYEQELERVQTQLDHFRLMLEGRVNKTIAEATEKSRIWRTLSEVMVGLTALMFLFVLGFILQATGALSRRSPERRGAATGIAGLCR